MMPWDSQPPRPQQPPYQPPPQNYPPQPQYQPPQPPQVPVVARNQQTGESVKLDIGAALQKAVNDALKENSRIAAANATKALQAKANSSFGIDGDETIEEAFQSGAVTKLTLARGLALDAGVGLVAAFATIADGPGFSVFDKELWTTIMPALLAKTVVQTFMSFAMSSKFK